MKQIYQILCIALGVFILILLYVQMEYTPIIIDKKIHEDTTSLLKKINKIVKKNSLPAKKQSPLSPQIWKQNLFDPLRGELEGTTSIAKLSKEPSDMELIGICNTNILKGAIILLKKNKYSFSSRNISSSSKAKRFFKVDDRLPNAYTLEDVGPDSVTLSKGNEQISLSLKYNDNDTTDRVSSVASKSVKEQLERIRSRRNKPSQNKPKASVKITPTNTNNRSKTIPKLRIIDREDS